MAEEGINQGGASASAMPPPFPPAEEDGGQTRGRGAAQAIAGKRPRGRPLGSKNKPKPPRIIARDKDCALQTFMIEIPPGFDIIKSISDLSFRRRQGICVLTCSGAVSNVTFLDSASAHGHTSTFMLHGRFEILSLTANFFSCLIPPPSSQPSSSSGSPKKLPITVTLAGANGQVIGGTVAGKVIASGPVSVLAASYKYLSVIRLQPASEEANDAYPNVVVADAGSMAMSVYGAQSPNTINRQLPPLNMPWSPASRPHLYM